MWLGFSAIHTGFESGRRHTGDELAGKSTPSAWRRTRGVETSASGHLMVPLGIGSAGRQVVELGRALGAEKRNPSDSGGGWVALGIAWFSRSGSAWLLCFLPSQLAQCYPAMRGLSPCIQSVLSAARISIFRRTTTWRPERCAAGQYADSMVWNTGSAMGDRLPWADDWLCCEMGWGG